MLEIPVYPEISSDFSMEVELGGVTCEFRFMWNSKTKFWMINTYNEPDNDLTFHGIKIIANYPVLYAYGPSFSGEIVCMKKANDVEDEITYTNFGQGYGLFYLTEAEFLELRRISGFQ